jgi:hypothetical protein
MADIRGLRAVDTHLLERPIAGYVSSEAYQAARHETQDIIRFGLQLAALETYARSARSRCIVCETLLPRTGFHLRRRRYFALHQQ